VDDVRMNALFGTEAKRSLRGLNGRQVRYRFGKRCARSRRFVSGASGRWPHDCLL